MEGATCLVGRVAHGGPWLGFAPSLDDGYLLVVTDGSSAHRAPAAPEDLVCLAIAYFEDALADAPEELAATHADIGALVRHVAGREAEPARARLLAEAVDAIDDGLAGDAVIGALVRCLPPGTRPIERLALRAAAVSSAT